MSIEEWQKNGRHRCACWKCGWQGWRMRVHSKPCPQCGGVVSKMMWNKNTERFEMMPTCANCIHWRYGDVTDFGLCDLYDMSCFKAFGCTMFEEKE